MIGKASLWNGLYVLTAHQPEIVFGKSICNSVSHNSPINWHVWLGHPSTRHLLALQKVLPHMNVKENVPDSPCLICPLAKQRRLSLLSNKNIVDRCFDLIHYNI